MWTKDEVADNNVLNSDTYVDIIDQTTNQVTIGTDAEYINGLFVGVRYVTSNIATSKDFFQWTNKDTRTNKNLFTMAYKDGVYIFGSDTGIVRSTNLSSFQVYNSNNPSRYAVTDNSIFACTGPNNTNIYKSTNGISWTVVSNVPSPTGTSSNPFKFLQCCGNRIYFNYSNTGTQEPLYVFDGDQFIQTNIINSTQKQNMFFANNKYIKVNGKTIYISDDGINFEEKQLPVSAHVVDGQNGIYVILPNRGNFMVTTKDFDFFSTTNITGGSTQASANDGEYIYADFTNAKYKFMLKNITYKNPNELINNMKKDIGSLIAAVGALQ